MSNPAKNWKYYLCAEIVELPLRQSSKQICVYPTLEEDTNDFDKLNQQFKNYSENIPILLRKLDEFVADEQSIEPGNYKLSRILFVNSSSNIHRKEIYIGINVSWNGSNFNQLHNE
jgi:hypothetical protein